MARLAASLKSSILHAMTVCNHLMKEFGQKSKKFCHVDAAFLADDPNNGRKANS
jgi:hypothetical protein